MRRLKLIPRLVMVTALLLGPLATSASAEVSISGEGSSFVGIEIDQWRADVSKFDSPLVVNYVASSSGIGRQSFAEPVSRRNIDFAISDIPYVAGAASPPTPFAYVPISAGGMAFMFNLKDKAGRRIRDLKLTPETACKIFTNQITTWSDPLLLADNPKLRPGVSQDKIKLVLRRGAAGTSFILGQFCIATAKTVWDQFQSDVLRFPENAQGYDGAPGPPTNQWPVPFGAVNAGNSEGNADQVANESTGESSICLVETGFATNRKFPVAAVKNAAGVFILPSDSAVTKALGYAGNDPTGTQKLDFVTPDANAYNPSTYSYAVVATTAEGLDPAKGTTLAKFLNYAVGAGQEKAGNLDYAPLPQNLVDLSFDLIAKIPGAPPKESYTAVRPKAPLVTEEETPDPGTNPGDGGTGGGGGGPAGGGGQTPAAGDGGGTGQNSAAGSDGGTGSSSGNSGGASNSGSGGSSAGSDSGGTAAAGGASTGAVTPGAAVDSTTVANVKGNTVTNGKTAVAAKPGTPTNAAGGKNQVAAGAFVEQASERSVDPDSPLPLAWVLALGAAGYLFARRGQKSVAT
jgi:phosphate transport system substrate-binding protein